MGRIKAISALPMVFGAGVAIVLCGCAGSPQAREAKHLAAGKKLFQQKDYGRAILEFKNAIKLMPRDPEPYYQVGLAYLGAGDLQSAAKGFTRAVELNPNFTDAQLKLAQLLAMAGDQEAVQQAEKQLRSLLGTSAGKPEVLNTLALTEMKLGKADQAIESLEQVLATSPRELIASGMLARAKLMKGDAKGAEEVLRKACEASNNSVNSRILLAQFYLSQKRYGEAEQQLRQVLAILPTNEIARLDLAKLQYAEDRKQEAGDSFKSLSTSKSDDFNALYGMFLLQEGRNEDAVREFERLFRQKPDDRVARTRLVAAYRTVGRKSDAENLLSAALKKNSMDLDALLQRAELFLSERKFEDAERDLNQVLRFKPNAAEVHYVLSKLYEARGEPLRVRQALSDAVRLNPSFLAARVELAQLLIRSGGAKAAIALLDDAPAAQKQLTPVLVQRNWALWSIGDMAQMRKGIDEGLSHERSADLLLQDGLWKLRNRDFQSARAALEQALNLSPTDLRALDGLRLSYKEQKESAMALEKVKEYASRSLHSAPVQQFYGDLLLSTGNIAAARQAFAAAKAADPGLKSVDLALVQADVAERKWDDARARLKALVSADGKNTTARLWLGNLEEIKGDHRAALEQFRKVVEAEPNNYQALNNLAYLVTEYENQPDEGLKYAQRAQELAPDRPAVQDTLGWILYRKGLYTSAVKYLESATSQKDNALFRYHLAMAYAKAGDRTRGREALQAALKINPNLPEAKTAREIFGMAR